MKHTLPHRRPLYRRVKDHILAQIRSGTLAPGSLVPSENQLVTKFGVSRMTANRALRELTHDGYLDRVPGVGTFVNEVPHQSSLIELRNIADEISSRGHRHQCKIVELRKLKSSRRLAARFEARPGTVLYRITAVHLENGVPVQLERRHVNSLAAPLFLQQNFAKLTPTAYLLSVAPVDELEHHVRAVLPDRQAQRLLRISAREPCLELHRRSWSGGDVVTEVTLTYPAGRYELRSRYRTSPSGRIASVSSID
jgi:GntR family histidine utilization transcriptional repressor